MCLLLHIPEKVNKIKYNNSNRKENKIKKIISWPKMDKDNLTVRKHIMIIIILITK